MYMRLDRVKMFTAMGLAGMNQKEVAESQGMSRATVSAVYNGKTCSPATARKIADALGVTVESLLENKAQ